MEHEERLKAALADRYHIEREIGSGGMATVYLARDRKHDRDVAVKVLKPELAAVLGVERFLSEIKVTANLQHPHILPLHDSGETDGFLFYVMPFVEGESLRARLDREKQLPVGEAVGIAESVGNALGYAHRQGVVHRDIKPANILLHDGQPMVADFGISLAVRAAGGARLTETGLSLGTPQYMSPEQASGDREVDGRSDTYSLACVLYEMLAGEPPHSGPTVQAVIAKLLAEKPRPVTELRETVPRHVAAAVQRALAKLPADRFGEAEEFVTALSDLEFGARLAQVRTHVGRRFDLPSIWQLLAGLGLAILAGWGWLRSPETPEVASFAVELPPGQEIEWSHDGVSLALSPDGRRLVYVGEGEGDRLLYVRDLEELDAVALPGTQGARDPFFSPDGEWVGFFTDAELKKVSLAGGPPIEIAPAPQGRGGTWSPNGEIVFAPNSTSPLFTVSDEGGIPEALSKLDSGRGEASHRWPHIFPDGQSALVTVWRGSADSSFVGAMSLPSGEITPLIPGAARALPISSSQIAYVDAAGVLLSVGFDSEAPGLTGSALPMVDSVVVKLSSTAAEFSLSESGTLAYLSGASESALVLLDRQGNERLLGTRTSRLRWPDTPRFSHDGRFVAYTAQVRSEPDVYVFDVAQDQPNRLTYLGNNMYPEWSSDDSWIGFSSEREGSGGRALFRKRADGSGGPELLLQTSYPVWELAWSHDGRWLVYRETHDNTSRDIWKLDLDAANDPEPVRRTPNDEQTATVSPNGRWLAFSAVEEGRDNIYVQSFPDGTGIRLISPDGGTEPHWSADGSELFYRHGRKMMAVQVGEERGLSISPPIELFEGPYQKNRNHPAYDVDPDGEQFVMIRSVQESASLVVVLNWTERLRGRAQDSRQ